MDAVRETVREAARALCEEAETTNERRLLVLAGGREAGYDAARAASEAACSDGAGLGAVSLSEREVVGERIAPDRADELLGTTQDCVVVDCHDATRPNALGRAAGAVDGGGLLVLVTPPLERWPHRRDEFDESLAVQPFGVEDVGSLFRGRLVETLRGHRGVAIVDVDTGRILDDGLTHPAPRRPTGGFDLPDDAGFPADVYEACLTADQRDAVRACEALREAGQAVVLEADRGRGKSSAAGLAAAALAAGGQEVLVTAPHYRNAAELFERAAGALDQLDALVADRRDDGVTSELEADGGRVGFRRPTEAAEANADATVDVLVVDEAAALPVRVLDSLLEVAPAACFATTVHGYEGAGRGFDVRFRHHLEERREVRTVVLSEPIRYAAADPVEVWLFRALLLDARPAVEPLVADATPAEVAYERLDPPALAHDENRLREVFGLLVEAHYRTEPDDLARLLDAPNVTVRALTVDRHVVSVALLAREGGLPAGTRREMYEGARVRGNMVPDVLTSQLRDPEAASPVGLRVLRIATHHVARLRGFGSRLLAEIEAEFGDGNDGGESDDGSLDGDAVDYLGVGYGATPELLSFWADAGYRTVHLSTTRNATSGEYSAIMLRSLTADGEELADRHCEWFRRRIPSVLSDALEDVKPDVVRAALAAVPGDVRLDLTDGEWRLVASAAYGPGLYDVAPRPFRRLALRALVDGALRIDDDAGADAAGTDAAGTDAAGSDGQASDALDESTDATDAARAERLLVTKVLQARPWDETTAVLGYVSRRECMRTLGDVYRPLVDRYGDERARAEADRYRSEGK